MARSTAMVASLIAVFVGVSSTAAQEQGGIEKTALRGEHGRRTQDSTAYCNSIGCPGGFIPIPDAQNTACGGECTADNCCIAFCAFFACPNGLTPIQESWAVQCTGNVCTQEQCCDALCAGYACPNNFIPIVDAQTTKCTDQVCTTEQCCQDNSNNDADQGNNNNNGNSTEPGNGGNTYCNSIGCPAGTVNIPDASNVACIDNVCSESQCCTPDSNNGNATDPNNGGNGNCNSIGCSAGLVPIPEAWITPCTGGVCTEAQCCDAFCSGFACNDTFTPVVDAWQIECPNQVCTQELCCEALCSGYACPPNFIPIVDASQVECTGQVCTTEQCCQDNSNNDADQGNNGDNGEGAMCFTYACPNDYTPIDDAQTTACTGGVCTTEQCCVATNA